MSIKLRLTLLLGLLLAGLLASVLVLRRIQSGEREQMRADDRRAHAQLLNHWIDLTSHSLSNFAADAAQSAEFNDLLTKANDAARKKINAALAAAGVNAAWIVRADGSVRAHFAAEARSTLDQLPLPSSDFSRLVAETPNPRFFAEATQTLLEIAVRRLAPPTGTGAEWLVVARVWDDAQLRSLGELTESAVTLGSPHDIAQLPTQEQHLVLIRTLADWRGNPLRTLRVDYDASELDQALRTDWRVAEVFFVFGLLVVTAVGLALNAWVLRPLGRIGESLAHQDPLPVKALSSEPTELGGVAQLVLTSFEQSEALRREMENLGRAHAALEKSESTQRRSLEERARLGRDLHDGVIQSLYAAGMGLAGIRAQLHPDQLEAAARLEQTRAALNETIHDVRNFIIGLEPEALKLQTFSQAVIAMLDTMHGLRAFHPKVSISESVAARLSLAQRVHALQITREAVSNALRHGNANTISVSLRIEGEFATFEIADDGAGFDPEISPAPGGLKNLAQRAQELGAVLTVDSRPGEGARVKLVFSFPLYDR